MRRSRDTLKKVLIIYIIAGALVALIYIQLNQYKAQKKEVKYAFSQEVDNDNIKMYIDDTKEIGTEPDNDNLSDQDENVVTTADTASDEQSQTGDKKFYKYKTTNRYNQLRVRKGPDTSEPIVDKLPPGAVGYVIEKGDEWSYIMTGRVEGYSSNSYLSFDEIDINELPDDFPEEYK